MPRLILTLLLVVLTLSAPATTWATDDAAAEMPPNPWAFSVPAVPRTDAEARGHARLTSPGVTYCVPCDRLVWSGCGDADLRGRFVWAPIPAMLELNKTLVLPRDIVEAAGVRVGLHHNGSHYAAEEWDERRRTVLKRVLASSLRTGVFAQSDRHPGLTRYVARRANPIRATPNDVLVDDLDHPTVILSCSGKAQDWVINGTCRFVMQEHGHLVKFWLPDSYMAIWPQIVDGVRETLEDYRCDGDAVESRGASR